MWAVKLLSLFASPKRPLILVIGEWPRSSPFSSMAITDSSVLDADDWQWIEPAENDLYDLCSSLICHRKSTLTNSLFL